MTTIRLKKFASMGEAFRVIRALQTLAELDAAVGPVAVVYGPEISDGAKKLLAEQCPKGTCFIEQETDFTLAMALDQASLLCLRMALVNRLNHLDALERDRQPDDFTRGERGRTLTLLERLPEA
jgi:hypothetical protein